MNKKYTLMAGLMILLASLFYSCKPEDILEPRGNARLQLTDCRLYDYYLPKGIRAKVYTTMYTQTDTSSSLVVTKSENYATIGDPNNFSLYFDYNFPEKIKKVRFAVALVSDTAVYAYSKVSVRSTTLVYNGASKYSEGYAEYPESDTMKVIEVDF